LISKTTGQQQDDKDWSEVVYFPFPRRFSSMTAAKREQIKEYWF